MAMYDFKIGTTQVGMTNLEALATPVIPPAWNYRKFQSDLDLGDHMVKGMGLPAAGWVWGFIVKAQKEMLRTFCPTGISSSVYIQTYKTDRSTGIFQAVMVWPIDEDDYAERTKDFTIQFKSMIEVTP